MKEYLFVYGVFRDSGKMLLNEVTFCGKSTVDGRIYKVNEFYPGFVRGSDGKVVGDIYLIDDSVFPQLDEFEGDEYIRKKIQTSSDIECWIYEYKYDVSKFNRIVGGDWMLRLSNRLK
jgi:gamma-glutamylcyclotransferase (GGCT)/AIG2-like uncharacterized protein YtfP